MHTFSISEAISGGIQAAIKKAIPLLLTFLLLGVVNYGVQKLIIGDMGASWNINYGSEAQLEDITSSYSDAIEEMATSGEFNPESFSSSVSDFSPTNPFEEVSFAKIGLAGFINFLVGIVMAVAVLTISLDAVFKRDFNFSNISKNFSRIPQLLLAAILIGLISLINIIPVLGWIAFAVIYFMLIQSPMVIMEEKLGAIESFKRSKTLMEGNKLKMFGLMILVVIISMVVSLATIVLGPIGSIIGMAIIGPISSCIMAHVYMQLSKGAVATAAKKVKEAVS